MRMARRPILSGQAEFYCNKGMGYAIGELGLDSWRL